MHQLVKATSSTSYLYIHSNHTADVLIIALAAAVAKSESTWNGFKVWWRIQNWEKGKSYGLSVGSV